uniref:Superoxide dismutase copper/zinc binding domain-containing protein n=1 Tax=Globodera rostochiensis TaxID=31243 RepID=A0A914HVM2_GLORO
MHDRVLSIWCWGCVLRAAAFDPNCKAFMDQLKDYLEDTSILKKKAVCVLTGDADSNVKGKNYQILKEMFDRLLLINQCWRVVVGAAGVEPVFKAFLDQVNDYFTYASKPAAQKIVCTLVGDTDQNVKGMVTFSLDSLTTQVAITGQISGLSPGAAHGFHVHEFSDLSNGCSTDGPHVNPINKSHGGPSGAFRHVGLLGHVDAGADGVAKFGFTGSGISLSGPHNIVGRTLVVHKLEDNLGHGLHGEEQENKMTTANLGPCLARGVIMIGFEAS